MLFVAQALVPSKCYVLSKILGRTILSMFAQVFHALAFQCENKLEIDTAAHHNASKPTENSHHSHFRNKYILSHVIRNIYSYTIHCVTTIQVVPYGHR